MLVTFEVTLTLSIKAPTRSAAYDLGVGAAEHLMDTFNDNDTIALIDVDSTPHHEFIPSPLPTNNT